MTPQYRAGYEKNLEALKEEHSRLLAARWGDGRHSLTAEQITKLDACIRDRVKLIFWHVNILAKTALNNSVHIRG